MSAICGYPQLQAVCEYPQTKVVCGYQQIDIRLKCRLTGVDVDDQKNLGAFGAPPTKASWAVVRTPEDLGRFLSRRRVEAGWTQRELAADLGFPYRYLHEIESGKHTLAYTRLFTLLRALSVDLRLEAAPIDPSDRRDDPWARRDASDFFSDFDDSSDGRPWGDQ